MNHKFNQYKYLDINELTLLNKTSSIKEIAKLKRLSPATISRAFRHHNIDIIKHNANKKSISKDVVMEAYKNHRGVRETAKHLNVSQTTLIGLMRQFNIQARDANANNRVVRNEFNAEWLKEQYVINNLSASKIGEMVRCSRQTIVQQLKIYGITKNKTDLRLQNAEWLKTQYEINNKTFWEIAKECDCSLRTVARWLHHHGINIRYNNLTSTYENEIAVFIAKIDPNTEIIKRFKMDDGREIDIMLPEYSIGIEFNGYYWHSSDFVDKQYHKQKYLQAKKQGIRLLQVWEHHWIISQSKIKELLISIIKGKSAIMARKCKIIEITTKISNEFCDRYHIQGARSAAINIGLYYDLQLVAVMTFNKYKAHYECIRYCGDPNFAIAGGAEKMFAYFLKQYGPHKIISYCSCDLFNGLVYRKLGMKLIKHTEPGYFYINDKMHVLSRIQCQKHKLIKMGFDNQKTESEIMRDRKYYQCFDSGNLLFEWNKQ